MGITTMGMAGIDTFCTIINCIDGRVQLPVNSYARIRFLVDHVDTITAPGPVRLFEEPDSAERRSILDQLKLSVTAHGSSSVAVVAHHDCAGNPVEDEVQKRQVREAAAFLAARFPRLDVLALWVNRFWYCEEVAFIRASK